MSYYGDMTIRATYIYAVPQTEQNEYADGVTAVNIVQEAEKIRKRLVETHRTTDDNIRLLSIEITHVGEKNSVNLDAVASITANAETSAQ